jgi:dienelactone hydrolase
LAPTPEARLQTALSLAKSGAWIFHSLHTTGFTLTSFTPAPSSFDVLSIYIEGDGLAWTSPDQKSRDPSPVNPIGLQLALAQPDGKSAYLARPCQYTSGAERNSCSSRYWTNERFSPLIIQSLNEGIDQLKERFKARRLILVGYSGGGGIASLIAGRRQDVNLIITVAGNLDGTRWAQEKTLSPLEGSLNPSDEIKRVSTIPQVHFTGDKDTVYPNSLTQEFAAKAHAKMIEVKDFDHVCCWAEAWPRLYKEALKELAGAH